VNASILMLLMVLCAPAAAQESPFTTLPKGHQAYAEMDAVEKYTGFEREVACFGSPSSISRYEGALTASKYHFSLQNALGNLWVAPGAKLPPISDQLLGAIESPARLRALMRSLRKLTDEFQRELRMLGSDPNKMRRDCDTAIEQAEHYREPARAFRLGSPLPSPAPKDAQ
jgi:hypothetical protein